jgi:hypothetical protein
MPRRRTFALPAAALALAAAALPVTAAGSTAARTFSHPLHVDVNAAQRTGEPSIIIAKDGTEYIVAPDGAGVRAPAAVGGAAGAGGSLIWRSEDHGKTWKLLGSFDIPTGGGDSDISVSPNGTLYASGLSYAACSTTAVSTDKGNTWVADPVAGCASFPAMNDRNWIATYGNKSVYTAIGDTFNQYIALIRSALTSPIVVPSQTINVYTGGDYQWPGSVAVDQRNGMTYTVWNTQGSPNDCDGFAGSKCAPAQASTAVPDKVMISALPDGATTAPAPITIASRKFDTFDSFVVDAVDHAGNIYAVWNERHPASNETWAMLSVSRNAGKTWTAPVRVNKGPRTATFPWVTAGDAGRIAVSYYGTSGRGVSPQRVPSDSQWQVYSAFSTDYGRTFTEYRTTATMQKGLICTSGTGCPSGSRNLLDFFETDLDPRGCLVTTFADNASQTGSGAIVSYVRQTAGPGLLAKTACSTAR